jgi:hypothetical protein
VIGWPRRRKEENLEFVDAIRAFNPLRSPSRVRRRAFEAIYRRNSWGDPESVSGPGSNIARASLFRPDFEAIVHDLTVRTLIDAGCGDFNWLSGFDLPIDLYIGIDIVPALIAQCRVRFASTNRRFLVRDMVCDRLPRADLIVCRDGLVHLRNAEILAALRNFRRSRSTWLLTNTFIDRPANDDLPATGDWRPINLEAPPFNLPAPARVLDERCLVSGGAFRDKRLALWPLSTLPA